ncbi:hypothetical protein EJ07DRAFT_158913 [Lizonia empirigonia]|nr:hypothetical protein EJ07DRAFT_158913 [Lizonia empirigonia]
MKPQATVQITNLHTTPRHAIPYKPPRQTPPTNPPPRAPSHNPSRHTLAPTNNLPLPNQQTPPPRPARCTPHLVPLHSIPTWSRSTPSPPPPRSPSRPKPCASARAPSRRRLAHLPRALPRHSTARSESTYYWGDAMDETPPSPVAGWAQAVARLPPGVDEVLLHVSRAPRGVRDKHPLVWKRFVGGRRAGERFLGGLVEQVAALVRGVEGCGGRVRVEMTGWLSMRSAFFVERVGEVLGREVEFVGEWVTEEEARVVRIAEAARSAAAKKQMWPGKRRGGG